MKRVPLTIEQRKGVMRAVYKVLNSEDMLRQLHEKLGAALEAEGVGYLNNDPPIIVSDIAPEFAVYAGSDFLGGLSPEADF